MTEATPPGGTYPLAGRPVARIGYGAMQLSPLGGRPGPSAEAAVALLRRAVELGVNHIDTAQFYGTGRSNDLIREALHPYPEDLVLVSKVGTVAGDGAPRAAQRPEELRAQVEQNLRSLSLDRLDVVNLRRMDSGRVVAAGDQVVDIDSQLAELADLRAEGKIGGIGVSTVSAEQVAQALPVGIACVQNAYSVLDRADEQLFALCVEHDIAWVPYFPLGSAFPGFPKVTENPVVLEAAAALGATPAQVGQAWLLAHGANVLLISGTSQVAHLEENIATADLQLDPGTIGALDGLMLGAA
jgi:pyridoxine 4-dehydrogenase